MPLSSTPAFVLQSSIFREQDKLVHLLSPGQGLLRAVAPGAARSRNRFGSLLELFSEGDFFYYWHEEKELVTISRGELRRSHFDWLSRPENIFYFSLLAEILVKQLPPGGGDARMYRLLSSLLAAGEEGSAAARLLPYALVWILQIEGLLFNPEVCSNCRARGFDRAWLRLDYRGLLCPDCRRGEPALLTAEDLLFIAWCRRHAPQELAAAPAASGRLLRVLANQIEHHGEFSLGCTQYLPEFK